MENMEKALTIWPEDTTQKQIPIDINITTNKTYEKIKYQLPYTSSTEHHLQHSLHNLKLKGEQASVDSDAVQQYPAKFAQITAANSYTPDQVFNADEFGLFWKKRQKEPIWLKITN